MQDLAAYRFAVGAELYTVGLPSPSSEETPNKFNK